MKLKPRVKIYQGGRCHQGEIPTHLEKEITKGSVQGKSAKDHEDKADFQAKAEKNKPENGDKSKNS